MKKLCWNCLKNLVLFLLIVSSVTKLFINHTRNNFDPIKEIQRLKSQNRKDDALDLARFFKKNQSADQEKFAEIEKDLEYMAAEKIKSFVWDGVIIEHGISSYS